MSKIVYGKRDTATVVSIEKAPHNIRTDLENDFQGLKDEINQMKEGYVLDVKLTREVY